MKFLGNDYHVGTVTTDKEVCIPQGSGGWTFAMITSLVATGVDWGDEGKPTTGIYDQTTGFLILDNYCNVKGIYERPDCELPWVIKENFLPFVGSVIDVDMVAATTAYFKFKYGDGIYAIKDKHGVCTSYPLTGGEATTGCRAGFPQSGQQPSKRSYPTSLNA